MEKISILILICCLFCACSRGDQSKAAPFQVSSGNVEPQKNISGPTDDLPSSIKINVFVGKRLDLKVKTGQKLNAGDVLTDRAEERAALLEQRKQLNLSLEQIAANLKLIRQFNDDLPKVSYLEANAAIRRAETTALNLSEKKKRQSSKLDFLKSSNAPEIVILHETAILDGIRDDERAALAETELARAQLKSAQEKRAFDEFQNVVRITNDKNGYRKETEAAAINTAQIKSQIVVIDSQLQKLGVVRVPFSGVVERISWEGQKDNEISVVIYFTVGDSAQSANN